VNEILDVLVRKWILGELEMVELRNVCKAFGDVRVLDGVNLCLERGFVFNLCSSEKQLLVFGSVLVPSECSESLKSIQNIFSQKNHKNGGKYHENQ